MCGIAAAAGIHLGRPVLQAMGQAMHHRGPDDSGTFSDGEASLVFRRLAIVDLEGGRQPMCNEDGRVHLVFNGEIYDHAELRRMLEAEGHRFATDHSDTEVLVHGWEQWRYDLFRRLNGMFAVAIWDQNTRTLVLARDRYGIKPLYFAPLPGGAVLFASEIKALRATGLVGDEPCSDGVLEYFSFQNLWREQTMFRGIHQLEPGTILTWRDRRLSRRKYWDITFPRSRRQSMPSLVEEHRDILTRSMRRQIAADVPVKTYLSGGIDSTAITVVSHRLDPQVTAYSCIFDLDDVGADQIVDERQYSRAVAYAYGLQRVELELRQDSLQQCLDDYVSSLEDLRMGMGYPVYLIAKRVAEDAKVVLSGTGGDEFHAGYVGRYQALGLSSAGGSPRGSWSRYLHPRRLLGACRRALRNLVRPAGLTVPAARGPEQTYRNILNFVFPSACLPQVFTPEFLRAAGGFAAEEAISDVLRRCPSDDWRDRVLYVDAKTYLAGLLTLEDKLSMAHSLETRVPLLDNELVDFILDVPFETLWQGDTGKVLFRESVRPWVPPEIYKKPKMGFGPPDASWYRGKLRPWIEETLSPRVCRERGVFQPAVVRAVLDEHFSGARDNYHLIWSLLNFEMWCRSFGFYGAGQRARTAGAA